ncbi:MAG: TonB family protein [Flavobacteriales bacterium]|jgi:protein TonB|nr:TonB family protein [Flavobacteriales bacterium]
METKKTEKANLELKKRRFFFIGLTIALSTTLAAFEWGTPCNRLFIGEVFDDDYDIEEEWSNVTRRNEPKKIIPEVKQKPKSTTIDVVPDELVQSNVDDTPEIPNIDDGDEIYYGVDEKQEVENLPPVTWAEEMPSFKCSNESEKEMFIYMAKQIKYPRIAKNNGIEGTVNIEFTISKNGKMKDVKVLRRVGGGCTEEAVRVIKSMKDWCPGKNNGIPVGVRFSVPIKFTLK